MVSTEPVALRRSLSVTGGSLLVCVIAPEAVYFSADSRYAGARGALRNAARKLIPWGESALCGLCGLLRFTRTEFDLREDAPVSQRTVEIADVISNLEAAGAQAEPALSGSLVDSFYRVFAPVWAEFAERLDRPFSRSAAASEGATQRLAQLLYANRAASGDVLLRSIDLIHHVSRTGRGDYNSRLEQPVVRTLFEGRALKRRLFVRGRRSCAGTPAIRRDEPALDAIDRIYRETQSASHCARVIGGPIDVAVIDNAGRRWLRRKAENA